MIRPPSTAFVVGAVLSVLLLTTMAVPLTARQPTCPEFGIRGRCFPPPPPPPVTRPDVTPQIFAANVLVGAMTGGIGAWQSDESFLRGFAKGALGGAGTYSGKWIATREFSTAGLLGRLVAATGSSVSRNAAHGSPILDRLILPVGPARVHVAQLSEVWLSFDVVSLGSLIYAAGAGGGAGLDWGRSLDSGAAVFVVDDPWGLDAQGRHVAGTVILGSGYGSRFGDRVLLHERAHVVQYDQAYILWGERMELAALSALSLPAPIVRHLDFSGHVLLELGIGALTPQYGRLLEREAQELTDTHVSH